MQVPERVAGEPVETPENRPPSSPSSCRSRAKARAVSGPAAPSELWLRRC